MHWGPTRPFTKSPIQTKPKQSPPSQARGRVTTTRRSSKSGQSVVFPYGLRASCTVDMPTHSITHSSSPQDPDLGSPTPRLSIDDPFVRSGIISEQHTSTSVSVCLCMCVRERAKKERKAHWSPTHQSPTQPKTTLPCRQPNRDGGK